MIVIHKTPTENVKSILHNGLKAGKPLLSQFDDYMIKRNDWYDKDLGLVFCFPEDTTRRDKYIRDFLYWKLWGDPRNRVLHEIDKIGYEQWDRVYDSGIDFFKMIKPKDAHFTIFKFELEDEKYDQCIHVQHGEMNGFPIWANMEIKYEHGFKPLILINENIPPEKLTIMGTAEAMINKKNKIDISIKL